MDYENKLSAAKHALELAETSRLKKNLKKSPTRIKFLSWNILRLS